MSTPGRQTKIITFYSHKAGAGRTMTLANIAWIMASHGKSVLAVDWDLEDPALHLYYSKYLPNRDLSTSDGILDMFSTFAATATSQERGSEHLRALHLQHTDFKRYDVDVHFPFPNGGHLYYLGPGRQDDRYRDRLRAFDWDRFQGTDDGKEFLAALRARMRESEYDYILIDSRAGFSADAGICTLALPDTVVIGLSLNRQAVEGARDIARRIEAQPRPIAFHVVPMRVDTTTEPTRFERALAEARTTLDPYLGITGEEALNAYWNEVLIPHQPRFSFSEELAVMIENPLQTRSLLHACVKAAQRITDGAVAVFEQAPRDLREDYVNWNGHADRDVTPPTVTVLNAPDDQLWADWIGEQLGAAGIKAQLAQPETEPFPGGLDADEDHDLDCGPDSDYVVALLSRRLEDTAAGQTIASLAVGAPVGGRPAAEGRGPADQHRATRPALRLAGRGQPRRTAGTRGPPGPALPLLPGGHRRPVLPGGPDALPGPAAGGGVPADARRPLRRTHPPTLRTAAAVDLLDGRLQRSTRPVGHEGNRQTPGGPGVRTPLRLPVRPGVVDPGRQRRRHPGRAA